MPLTNEMFNRLKQILTIFICVLKLLWQHENKENSKMDTTFFYYAPSHAGANYNNARCNKTKPSLLLSFLTFIISFCFFKAREDEISSDDIKKVGEGM